VTWRSCKQDHAGHHILIGDIGNAGIESIENVLLMFDEHAGCTWRVGKTGVERIFERAVGYECVHRVPTNLGRTITSIRVGKMYQIDKFGDRMLVCIRDEGFGEYTFFDKADDKETRVIESECNFVEIGKNRLSFGCRATLTFHKVLAGRIVVQVLWSHNHDLNAFATMRRRDPAKFVKDWFLKEYSKGVPAMKALRLYVHHMIEESGSKAGVVAKVIADRWMSYRVCDN